MSLLISFTTTGCIPIIIADDIEFPYESEINYSAFTLKLPEKDVNNIMEIMRGKGTFDEGYGGGRVGTSSDASAKCIFQSSDATNAEL